MALSTSRVAFVGALSTVLLGCSLGCSAEGKQQPDATVSASPSASAPAPAAAQVRVGKVRGFLTAAQQQKAVSDVGAVVDSWIEDAWVAGEWPRAVGDVWGAFTPGAAEQARAEPELTSAAHYAERVDSVRPTRRDVSVDLFARQGVTHGATARVTVNLSVTPIDPAAGEKQRIALRGRLFLTPEDGGWKIFGYTLARGGW